MLCLLWLHSGFILLFILAFILRSFLRMQFDEIRDKIEW